MTALVLAMDIDMNKALELAYECEPYGKIAQALNFTSLTSFDHYRIQHPLFDKALKSARDHGLERLAHSTIGLVDQYENSNHARAKFEAIKWFCGVMNPQVYGQRIDVTQTITVDLSAALDASNRRVERLVSPIASDSADLW